MNDQQPPKTLRVGDVVLLHRGERLLVEQLDPVNGTAVFQPICKDGRARCRGHHTEYGWSGSYRDRGYEQKVERNIFTDPEPSWQVIDGGGSIRTGDEFAPCFLVKYVNNSLTVRKFQWEEFGLPKPAIIPLELPTYSRRS